MDQSRIEAFRALKPPCVELSQVALRYRAKRATAKDLIKALEAVYSTLHSASKKANALDVKLADYAFFPLASIFRDSKDLPVRVVEVALQCLQILISHGWRGNLSLDLGKQLLLLLSLYAGGSATDSKVATVNEEVGSVSFACIASIFEGSTGNILGRDPLSSDVVPILGHTVTVILDGITVGPSVKVRLNASTALHNLITTMSDEEALKNIFPGIVSSLTKVLSSDSRSKTSYKVLIASLEALTKILGKVLRDDMPELSNRNSAATMTVKNGNSKSGTWATATAAQVKMSLANIIRLRYHERLDVQDALFQLCIFVVRECKLTLSNSISMLTETLVVLCSHSSDSNDPKLFNIGSMFATDNGLLEIIKFSLHDWVVSLPRVMQTSDDTRKRRAVDQISTAFKLLENQVSNLDVLNDTMLTNLRASVSAAIHAPPQQIRPVSENSLEFTQVLQSANHTSGLMHFSPVIFTESGNKDSGMAFERLTTQLKTLPSSTGLKQGIVGSLRQTSGDELLACLWLSLHLMNDASLDEAAMDQYLNIPQEQDVEIEFLDDVYSISLDLLSSSIFEDEEQWKLQALALEAVALQASKQNKSFRPELVDALYPVLERLGSNNVALQRHAMTCLNIVSKACEYPNPASLIIDNADYLVNAVALKLNTFDISPQAPQVLVMMVKLCGSPLIPYLDDLVESIFSILACYHGYPKLVDSLFSVLNAIVEEAATSSTRAIKSKLETITRPQAYTPLSVDDLAATLQSNSQRASHEELSLPPSRPSSPPSLSKFTAKSAHPEVESDPEQDLEIADQDSEKIEEQPPEPPAPTLSKTYKLVSSITSLTPAHLTTPSPPLRSHILTLLVSAFPVLASNEDTLLPLAATLWPAITARLYDPEPYITVTAAHALSTLCECVGDFFFGRVEEEWERLRKLYERVEMEMREEARVYGKGSRIKGTKWRVWDAVIELVLAILRHVGISDDVEDGLFEMLGGILEEKDGVREVLEGLNTDALWLLEEQARRRAGGGALQWPWEQGGRKFKSDLRSVLL